MAIALAVVMMVKSSKEYGMTLMNIGVVYDNKKEYEQALKYYGGARKVFELTGKSSKEYGMTLMNIGVVY